ncbi:hypothetical protein [Bacillus manliponensis]|uniref:hypothetical protein n=1 Tax=Bacillus manliponensis TaxID=574376 RepID=UPI003511E341
MNHFKINKMIYLFVHFIFPVTYFTLSTAWGLFFTSKPLSTNIVDNLCIMAIYYVLASIISLFYFNRLQTDIDTIVTEIEKKK